MKCIQLIGMVGIVDTEGNELDNADDMGDQTKNAMARVGQVSPHTICHQVCHQAIYGPIMPRHAFESDKLHASTNTSYVVILTDCL